MSRFLLTLAQYIEHFYGSSLFDVGKVGGRCPPNPLGFFALGLIPKRYNKARSGENPLLFGLSPLGRRSGRVPALPYPPPR